MVARSGEPVPAADPMGAAFEKVRLELEQWLQAGLVGLGSTQVNQLHSLHETLMVVRNSRDPTFGGSLVQRAIDNLLESAATQGVEPDALIRFREINLHVLKSLQDQQAFGPQWTNKQIAR
jgi:CCR4-NOT transcription complex subunit 1